MTKLFSNNWLTENQGNGFIELVYPPSEGMNAKEIGEAILGMQTCLREAAEIAKIDDFEVIIFPAERGSFKTIFAFTKKNGWKIIVGIDFVFHLINGGFDLVEHFGANKAHNPDKETIERAMNVEVLDLCKNKNFILGSQKIVSPLKETVQKVEIRYRENETEIKCENRQKFFEELEKEEILPELKNGETINIAGEIVRINKEYGDLGFRYKDRTIKSSPIDNSSVIQYHNLLEEDQVLLCGMVIRENNFETPQIKIISIKKIKDSQKQLPFKN